MSVALYFAAALARALAQPTSGLGERLVRARGARGFSQTQAAAEIGVSKMTVARIEAGAVVSAETEHKVRQWL